MYERGTCLKSLVEEMNGCRELGYYSTVCLCCVLIDSRFDGFVVVRSGLASIDRFKSFSMGRFAFHFIDQGKVRVTTEEKRRNERERMAFRTVGSFLSFMQVPLTL